MAISILYSWKGFIKRGGQANFFQNFKQPKSRKDSSDLDDFWTNRIASVPAIIWKKIAPLKQIPRGRKRRKTFATSSKKLAWPPFSNEKQNRNDRMTVKRILTSTMLLDGRKPAGPLQCKMAISILFFIRKRRPGQLFRSFRESFFNVFALAEFVSTAQTNFKF